MNDLENLVDDDGLRISYCAGKSDKLVVVFSGVGTKRFEQPRIEMFNAATQHLQHHALFVTDANRSWLNAPGQDLLIASTVAKVVAQLSPASVTLLGNSMGGTQALLLSNLIPCTSVLAFSPQFSIHPNVVPEELRWMYFRRKIRHFTYPYVTNLNASNKLIQIVHGDTPDERVHAMRFEHTAQLRHYILPGMDHNLVKKLKNDGALNVLIKHAINRHPRRFRGILRDYGARFRSAYEVENCALSSIKKAA